MCNCSEMPEYFADPYYWNKNVTFAGVDENPEYFEGIDSENWEPEMDFGNPILKCRECGQIWYFEYAPEEGAFPIFGLKHNGLEHLPVSSAISEAKKNLCLLAHGGTSNAICRQSGCTTKKLKGRELCVEHIGFP